MSSLTACLKIAGKAISKEDIALIKSLRKNYIDDGLSNQKAVLAAVTDAIELAESDYAEVVKAIEAQGGEVPARVEPVKKPAKQAAPDKRVGKFRTMADNMQEKIDYQLNPDVSQQNATPRRARIAAGMQKEGIRLQKQQVLLRGIADALEAGTLPDVLNTIKSKRDLEYDRVTDEQKAAIKDLIGDKAELTQEQKTEQRIKDLERELIGQKGVGIDLFPTPPEMVNRMVEEAGIEEGMKVLEPSAGTGNIAEAMAEAGSKPDVLEISAALQEILELKGYNRVGNDFLAYSPGEIYDRIVMNPPFSKGRDVEHIQHAYSMLKPGGRIVALASEHPFFASDKKSKEFREWLDEIGTSEKLASGDLADKRVTQRSNVNGRLITIDKPEAAALETDLAGAVDKQAQAVSDATLAKDEKRQGKEEVPVESGEFFGQLEPDLFEGKAEAAGEKIEDFGESAAANLGITGAKIIQSLANGVPLNADELAYLFESKPFLDELNNAISIDSLPLSARKTSEAVDSNASAGEGGVNGVAGDVKAISDIIKSKPFSEQGFSGLDAKTQRLMYSHVLALSHNSKVIDAVVKFIPVAVMDNLSRQELSANTVFNDPSMVAHPARWAANLGGDVPSSSDAASSLVRAITLAGAEVGTGRVISDLIGPALEGGAASGAVDVNHGKDNTRNDREGKSKETDKGVALYSKTAYSSAPGQAKGITRAQAERVVAEFTKQYKGANQLTFLSARDKTQAFGPEEAAKLQNQRVRAAYLGQSVVLVENELDSIDEAWEAIRHEVIGHAGMDTFNPAEKQALIDLVKTSRTSKSAAKLWAMADRDYAGASEDVKAKEVIAYLAQNKSSRFTKLWNQLLTLIRKGLRTIGLIPEGYGRAELISLVEELGARIKRGEPQRTFPESDTAEFAASPEKPLYSKTTKHRVTGTDAQEAAIAAAIDIPENEIPWRQRLKNAVQKFRSIDGAELRQGFIDEFASIEALERGYYGKVVDARISPSKAVRRTKNLDSVMAAMMLKGPLEYVDGSFQIKEGGKGLTEIFDSLSKKGLLHLWEGWAAANRADRLMGEGKEHNFTQDQIDELLKLEVKYPEFRTVLNDYQAFNKGVLDMAETAGVIDGEARQLWERNDYVPFFRAMEDVLNGEVQVKGPSNKRGLSGQQSGIKTLKGGEDKIGSVIENIVMNAAHLVDASFKTVALRRVVAIGNGISMEKVEPGFQPVGIDAGQIVTTLRKAGIIPSAKVARQIAKETGVSVGSPLSADERKQYLNMFRRVAPAGNDIISMMRKGKPEYYRVTDPLLLRSITSMGVRNVNGMMKLMRGSKRLLTAMVTADPAFMVANFIRDTLSTAVVSHVGLKPGVDAVKGFGAALKEDPALLAIMAAGGGGGGYYHSTPAEIRQNLHHHLSEIRDKRFRETVLDSPKKLWRAWQKVGAASENANRIAIFKAIKKKGGSTAEAVHQAQDILNFTQTGDFAAMRFMIETVPFMNARIQGLDRLYRGYREDPRGFALKGMMITAATLALLAKNWDDDEYEELPEWDRDIYWHFFLGEKDKNGYSEHHFRLPKPFEVGAIFGTLPERFARGASGKDDTKIMVQTAGRMFGETFAMNPIPQLFKPVVEQYSNKTFFTGTPIIGMALQRLRPEAQYDPWTSESMRGIADAMPDWAPDWLRSPKRLETALRGYLGTVGMYAVETSDKLVREAGGFPEHPALRIDEIPVVKRFVRGTPPRSTKYTGQFYDMVRDANEIYSTVKRYRQQGRVEKAGELAADNAGKLRARKALNKMASRMTAINNRMKRIYSDDDMSRQEKRESIDRLTILKQQLVRQAGRFADGF